MTEEDRMDTDTVELAPPRAKKASGGQRSWQVLAESANESRVCGTFRGFVRAGSGWAALTKGVRELRRISRGKGRPTQWSLVVELGHEGGKE